MQKESSITGDDWRRALAAARNRRKGAIERLYNPMKEKIHYPTLDEALSCADSWEQSTSLSKQAMFRRAGVVLAREVRRLDRTWQSDSAIFRGALQLLNEAGLAPGSAELIAACARFDGTKPEPPTTPGDDAIMT